MKKTNGYAKELTYEEKKAELDKLLKKVDESFKKYGNPFEGMTTMEIIEKVRENAPRELFLTRSDSENI